MANKAQKISTIKGIPTLSFTDAELKAMKTEELDAIIEKNNGVTPAPVTPDNKVAVPKGKAKESVTFTLQNGKKRVFTPEDHGKDFVETANEFHETNKAIIVDRQDE